MPFYNSKILALAFLCSGLWSVEWLSLGRSPSTACSDQPLFHAIRFYDRPGNELKLPAGLGSCPPSKVSSLSICQRSRLSGECRLVTCLLPFPALIQGKSIGSRPENFLWASGFHWGLMRWIFCRAVNLTAHIYRLRCERRRICTSRSDLGKGT